MFCRPISQILKLLTLCVSCTLLIIGSNNKQTNISCELASDSTSSYQVCPSSSTYLTNVEDSTWSFSTSAPKRGGKRSVQPKWAILCGMPTCKIIKLTEEILSNYLVEFSTITTAYQKMNCFLTKRGQSI